jgi:hypothetical protein
MSSNCFCLSLFFLAFFPPTEVLESISKNDVPVSKGYVTTPSKYDKLITSLRTAYATELDLDKKQTSYDDLLDALRLSLKAFKFE